METMTLSSDTTSSCNHPDVTARSRKALSLCFTESMDSKKKSTTLRPSVHRDAVVLQVGHDMT